METTKLAKAKENVNHLLTLRENLIKQLCSDFKYLEIEFSPDSWLKGLSVQLSLDLDFNITTRDGSATNYYEQFTLALLEDYERSLAQPFKTESVSEQTLSQLKKQIATLEFSKELTKKLFPTVSFNERKYKSFNPSILPYLEFSFFKVPEFSLQSHEGIKTLINALEQFRTLREDIFSLFLDALQKSNTEDPEKIKLWFNAILSNVCKQEEEFFIYSSNLIEVVKEHFSGKKHHIMDFARTWMAEISFNLFEGLETGEANESSVTSFEDFLYLQQMMTGWFKRLQLSAALPFNYVTVVSFVSKIHEINTNTLDWTGDILDLHNSTLLNDAGDYFREWMIKNEDFFVKITEFSSYNKNAINSLLSFWKEQIQAQKAFFRPENVHSRLSLLNLKEREILSSLNSKIEQIQKLSLETEDSYKMVAKNAEYNDRKTLAFHSPSLFFAKIKSNERAFSSVSDLVEEMELTKKPEFLISKLENPKNSDVLKEYPLKEWYFVKDSTSKTLKLLNLRFEAIELLAELFSTNYQQFFTLLLSKSFYIPISTLKLFIKAKETIAPLWDNHISLSEKSRTFFKQPSYAEQLFSTFSNNKKNEGVYEIVKAKVKNRPNTLAEFYSRATGYADYRMQYMLPALSERLAKIHCKLHSSFEKRDIDAVKETNVPNTTAYHFRKATLLSVLSKESESFAFGYEALTNRLSEPKIWLNRDFLFECLPYKEQHGEELKFKGIKYLPFAEAEAMNLIEQKNFQEAAYYKEALDKAEISKARKSIMLNLFAPVIGGDLTPPTITENAELPKRSVISVLSTITEEAVKIQPKKEGKLFEKEFVLKMRKEDRMSLTLSRYDFISNKLDFFSHLDEIRPPYYQGLFPLMFHPFVEVDQGSLFNLMLDLLSSLKTNDALFTQDKETMYLKDLLLAPDSELTNDMIKDVIIEVANYAKQAFRWEKLFCQKLGQQEPELAPTVIKWSNKEANEVYTLPIFDKLNLKEFNTKPILYVQYSNLLKLKAVLMEMLEFLERRLSFQPKNDPRC